ncbi:MAG: flagellar biosynthesis protein FlhF, partial [Lachnospiraceae bacterium]
KKTTEAFLKGTGDKTDKEVYLVLSATTKYRDLVKIADVYKELADYKLIFTKLDETTALGNLFNLKLYTGAPMSYITCGQNVPDDIRPFNPQSTVKQILSSNEQGMKG